MHKLSGVRKVPCHRVRTRLKASSTPSHLLISSRDTLQTIRLSNIGTGVMSSMRKQDDRLSRSFREAKNGEVRHYDWILGYELLRPHLLPYLKASDEILMVGCGNSSILWPSLN